MKKISMIGLSVVLIIMLLVPSVAFAAKPVSAPQMVDFEIITKAGGKGLTLLGSTAMGPKAFAASGILGEEVSGDRYGIIIGISDYPGDQHVIVGGYDLSYADDDAYDVDLLLGSYGFTNTLLIDTAATREAVLNAIAAVREQVSEDDEVVFFFSGHGVKYSPVLTPSSGGGKVGILTSEMAAISDKELKAAFKGFNTNRIIFMFDCCLAGGMIELGGDGRIVCMATTQNGTAIEIGKDYGPYSPDYNNGLFTYSLIEQGMLSGFADYFSDMPDGIVTLEEAYDFARGFMHYMSEANAPLFWQIPTIRDNFEDDLRF